MQASPAKPAAGVLASPLAQLRAIPRLPPRAPRSLLRTLARAAPTPQAAVPQPAAEAVAATRVVAANSTASISRILMVGQPNVMRAVRNSSSRGLPTGPISLLLFLCALVAGLFAAIRAAMIRKVKNCRCCKGYGIMRCKLCEGSGKVNWQAKWGHFEMCPLCMSKRFAVCEECGGHHHKSLFGHMRPAAPAGAPTDPAGAAGDEPTLDSPVLWR